MKLILINRERLMSLGSFLVDEFDSLRARIQAGWNVEHTPEGTHGHVHAETVATGRLTFDDIAEVTIAESQVNNFDPGGLSTAVVLRLDSALAEVSLTGLRVPQDESGVVLDGRVLVLENVTTGTTFTLDAESTFSAPRNRFVTPWGPPASASNPLRLYLRPSTLTMLVYNAKKARWLVHSAGNDASVTFETFAASQHDNVNTDAVRQARTFRVNFSGAGGSISGFIGTGVPETTRITLVNVGLYTFSVLHQNTSSSTANRVQCPGGVRYLVHPRESVDLYKTSDGWRIIEKADQWIDVAHAAGNFTVSGGGSWTVEAGDQGTYTYQLDGNKMTVSFVLSNTDVGATATALLIAIPAGRMAARQMWNHLAYAVNAGVAAPQAYCRVVAGGTVIEVYADIAGTAWTGTTGDNTSIAGQITFMVRDDCASISESHTDTAHGDTGHSDADHSDVAHSDVAHTDTHDDVPHADASHSDIAHSDTHSDNAHADSHTDTAHEDVAHTDGHGDSHIDHSDVGHADTHVDTHGDVTHEDTAHDDTHTDTAHSDTHSDQAHSDSAHSDVAHSDSHSDTPPHEDVPHIDGGHGDTPHSDAVHQDVGYHCDTAHSDI